MSKRKTTDWKNRIVEYGEMPANQYLAHELNARRHPGKQREALIGSLNEVGWVAPVIVSARTGKLLDGHARIEETLTKDENAPVPFVKVDVSENEERTILASFDPITGLATYDREALDALLRDVSTGEAALQEMLAKLAEDHQLFDLNVDENDLDSVEKERVTRVDLNVDQFSFYHVITKNITVPSLDYLVSYALISSDFIKPSNIKSLMLDSGILTLSKRLKDKCLTIQPEIISRANELKADRVVMLDVPAIPECLEPLKLTVKEAAEITLKNAEQFALSETSAQKVFVLQGPEILDYVQNAKKLQKYVKENDVIAIGGGLKDKSMNHQWIAELMNNVRSYFPLNPFHLLGVGHPQTIKACLPFGVTSADSSTADLNGSAFTRYLIWNGQKIDQKPLNEMLGREVKNNHYWRTMLICNNIVALDLYIKTQLFSDV